MSGTTARPIYLDYQATTPTDERVVQAMLPFFHENFGNPHSVHHLYGHEAEAAVEAARAHIAALIGAEPREIVFTSGATESNNLAIKGAARFAKERQDHKDHVVTVASEHKCVLECVSRLQREGFRTTILPVERDGVVDLQRLEEALDETTVLVTVMAANNEIGVLQPVAEIGRLCRARGVLFHSDAAQAAGKVPLDVNAMTIDLLSISGHKIYGPMGIGALYIRRRPRVRLIPEMDGGGQERGFRSGTVPTPLSIGLGEACRIAHEEMEGEARRLTEFRESFFQRVSGALEGVELNGHRGLRLPGNLNLSFRGIDAERLIRALPEVAVSTGSACTSAAVEPSYVLRALGLEEDLARAGLRIGFGRQTTAEEVSRAAELIVTAVRRLRKEAPRAAE
jgi:cysteine desulfurase